MRGGASTSATGCQASAANAGPSHLPRPDLLAARRARALTEAHPRDASLATRGPDGALCLGTPRDPTVTASILGNGAPLPACGKTST